MPATLEQQHALRCAIGGRLRASPTIADILYQLPSRPHRQNAATVPSVNRASLDLHIDQHALARFGGAGRRDTTGKPL